MATIPRLGFDLKQAQVDEHVNQLACRPEDEDVVALANFMLSPSEGGPQAKLPELKPVERKSVDFRVRELLAKALQRPIQYPDDLLAFSMRIKKICGGFPSAAISNVTVISMKLIGLLKECPVEIRRKFAKVELQTVMEDPEGRKTLQNLSFSAVIDSFIVQAIEGMVNLFQAEFGEAIVNFDEECAVYKEDAYKNFSDLHNQLADLMGMISEFASIPEHPWLQEVEECIDLIYRGVTNPSKFFPLLFSPVGDTCNPSLEVVPFCARNFINISNCVLDDLKVRFSKMRARLVPIEVGTSVKSALRQFFRRAQNHEDLVELIKIAGDFEKMLNEAISLQRRRYSFSGYTKFSKCIRELHKICNLLKDKFVKFVSRINDLSDEFEALTTEPNLLPLRVHWHTYSQMLNFSVLHFLTTTTKTYHYFLHKITSDLSFIKGEVVKLFSSVVLQKHALCHIRWLDLFQLQLMQEVPKEKLFALMRLFSHIRTFTASKSERLEGSKDLEPAFAEYLQIDPEPPPLLLALMSNFVPCSLVGYFIINPVGANFEPNLDDLSFFHQLLVNFPSAPYMEMEGRLFNCIQKIEQAALGKSNLLLETKEVYSQLVHWNGYLRELKKQLEEPFSEASTKRQIQEFTQEFNKLRSSLESLDIEEESADEVKELLDNLGELFIDSSSFVEGLCLYGNELSLFNEIKPPKKISTAQAVAASVEVPQTAQGTLTDLVHSLNLVEKDASIINIQEGLLPVVEELLNLPPEILENYTQIFLSKLALILEQSLNYALDRAKIAYIKNHNLEAYCQSLPSPLPQESLEVVRTLNGFSSSKCFSSKPLIALVKSWAKQSEFLHQLAEKALSISRSLILSDRPPVEKTQTLLMRRITAPSIDLEINLTPLTEIVDRVQKLIAGKKLKPIGRCSLFLREKQISQSSLSLSENLSEVLSIMQQITPQRATLAFSTLFLKLALMIQETLLLMLALSPLIGKDHKRHILLEQYRDRPIRYSHDLRILSELVTKGYEIGDTPNQELFHELSHEIAHHSRYLSQYSEESLSRLQREVVRLRRSDDVDAITALFKNEVARTIANTSGLIHSLLGKLIA